MYRINQRGETLLGEMERNAWPGELRRDGEKCARELRRDEEKCLGQGVEKRWREMLRPGS